MRSTGGPAPVLGHSSIRLEEIVGRKSAVHRNRDQPDSPDRWTFLVDTRRLFPGSSLGRIVLDATVAVAISAADGCSGRGHTHAYRRTACYSRFGTARG